MAENCRFGSADFDEFDDSELSLCCICGKTFTDRRSLHLHVAIAHGDSEAPPLAHSSSLHRIDEMDRGVPPLPSAELAAVASTINSEECGGDSSDDSCHPQDLRIRRSPIDTLPSGSMATFPARQAPPPPPAPLPPRHIHHRPSTPGSLTNASSTYFLYHRYHDISRGEACEVQSDAINSGQSSVTEFPSTEHLPSQTNSPVGKSYHCELCNKNFTKSCNLNSHVKAVHKGVRAFQCSECQKSFSRNSDLQKHIDAVHKGLRPYECITCKKRFSQKSSLKRHREAVHEGIKAFQCSHCSARFSYDVHLKRHTRAKHKTFATSNTNGNPGTAAAAAAATAASESVSSNSLPSSPVFQPTSLRQASI